MTKKISINLKFPVNSHYIYSGIHISNRMQVSGLLRLIKAKELAECNYSNGQARHHEHYKNSGELEDRGTYEVHTNNLDKTLELIKNYNHKI